MSHFRFVTLSMIVIAFTGALLSIAHAANKPVSKFILNQTAVQQALHLAQFETHDIFIPQNVSGPIDINVSLEGVQHTLQLQPHSIRSDDFRLLVEIAPGQLVEKLAPKPRTYKGTVQGIPDSRVAASIRNGQLHASIILGDDQPLWGIQPLTDVQTLAPKIAHIIHSATDVNPDDWTCGVDHNLPDFQPLQEPPAQGGVAGTGLTNCDIAVDTDFEFFARNGASVEAAMHTLEDIMNRTETIYETHSQISITYEVTTAIIRLVPGYYTSPEPQSLLYEFMAKWDASMTDVRRDVAHLLSGKPNTVIIGVAFLGVICNSGVASANYGMSLSNFSGNMTLRTCLTAHEIGHNWNAGHCDANGDCGIMCSVINSCPAGCTLFGAQSINAIVNHRAQRFNQCLNLHPESTTIPFFEDFPTTSLDEVKWSYNNRGSVTAGAVDEPSPPNSLTLNGLGPGEFQGDDVRTNFMLASGNFDDLIIKYKAQRNGGTLPGDELIVDYWNNDVTWVEINRVANLPTEDYSQFTLFEHELPADASHDELRLRLRSNLTEPGDTWYVDDILVAVAPVNNKCAGSPVASLGETPFTTIYATTDGPEEPDNCGFGDDFAMISDVWFRYASTCNGTVTVSICDADFDSQLAVYVGCPATSGLAITCNDNACGTSPEVSFAAEFGSIYTIRIAGANGEEGAGILRIACNEPGTCLCFNTCPEDISPVPGGNGFVNVDDLLGLVGAWGPCGKGECIADFDGNDIVNVNDLLQLVGAWGPCPN